MGLFSFGKKQGKLCVLHIDDSRWIRIPVSILLRRHFGMRVLEASSGEEGIQLAQLETPDMIILDVMMPQMDGFHTLAKLKESALTKDIPVLMCTVRDLASEVNTALQLGASGYLTKPIEEDVLVSKVRELLISMGKWNDVQFVGASYKDPTRPTEADTIRPSAKEPEADYRPRQARQAVGAAQPVRPCPSCRQQLDFITQYNAWYCYPCRKYPDFERS